MTSYNRHGSQKIGSEVEQSQGLVWRFLEELLAIVGRYIPYLQARSSRSYPHGTINGGLHSSQEPWKLRSILDVRLGLIILWVLVLWWGEEAVFTGAVRDCAWDRWESWVEHSKNACVVMTLLIKLAAS